MTFYRRKKIRKNPKGTLSDLRPFLATKSLLKMMKMTSQPIEINNCSTHIAQYIKKKQAIWRGRGGEGWGTEGAAALPKFSVDMPFFAN